MATEEPTRRSGGDGVQDTAERGGVGVGVTGPEVRGVCGSLWVLSRRPRRLRPQGPASSSLLWPETSLRLQEEEGRSSTTTANNDNKMREAAAPLLTVVLLVFLVLFVVLAVQIAVHLSVLQRRGRLKCSEDSRL